MAQARQAHQATRSQQIFETKRKAGDELQRTAAWIGITQIEPLYRPLLCDRGGREQAYRVCTHSAIGVENDDDVWRIALETPDAEVQRKALATTRWILPLDHVGSALPG